MASLKSSDGLKLWHVFPSAPPKEITQQPFDSSPEHLRSLARLHRGDKAEAGDLWEYTQDLLYSDDIQDSLFKFLLPFCLTAWHDDLRGADSSYGGFVEHFYPVLANKHVFDVHLTPVQTTAVSDFMRHSILEEIDEQRGLTYEGTGVRPYRWVTALTTHGVILSDVQKLWDSWWLIDTVGKAVAAVQYISCLVYAANENPVFAPWTPDGGGGPPCLWEFGGHLYEHRWLESNVRFLKRTLNPQQVSEVLSRAVERLADQPESTIAAEVQADLPLCSETLASRCAELPRLLERQQEPSKSFEWTK